jgi:hypothetical protein
MSGPVLTKEKVPDHGCRCVRCSECNGTGTVWFSFGSPAYGGGQYLGSHRSDDMDEMETCDECRGSGISEECDTCSFQREIEEADYV